MNAVVRTDKAVEILNETAESLKAQHATALAKATAGMATLRDEIESLRALVAGMKLQHGEPGAPGERGPQGKDGRDGVDGKNGVDGERGLSGKDGRDGVDGRDGRDCDMARVEQLVRDLVAAIPRPRDGKDGIDGHHGKDGAAGRDGRDGERGDRGPVGRDGRDGQDGIDGRDAAQIEVLEAIVEGRSYARGTWAKRDGGLWRFSGAEWVCVVDGVKSIDVEQVGERTFRVLTTYASAAKSQRDFNVPAIIDRGVWEAKAYDVGDCVTWDGSMWIAKATATDLDKPGESSTWRLAVKRGRNGKS